MDTRSLGVKVFCDSGSLTDMRAMEAAGLVSGFTCNPTLVRKAGVTDYLTFCIEAARSFPRYSVSLEVIADEPSEIQRQAKLLAELGGNVYVKVPVVSSEGQPNTDTIATLSRSGVHVNVTAVFTLPQIESIVTALDPETPAYLSVFAGRIADAGQDPCETVRRAVWATNGSATEIIWASCREPYNVIQAAHAGADIITVFPEMLKKLHLFGKDLGEFSRETSAMFYRDAVAAGYAL